MNIRTKRITLLALALVMLLSCFTGCTKVDDSDADQPGSSTPSEPSQGQQIEIDPLAREAVVKTALAYLARSTRIQYDDRSLYDSKPINAEELYRWQSCVRKSPEEYTSQYVGYTNCAAFVGEVYLAALGTDLGTKTTGALSSISDTRRVFKYKPTGKETADEMEAIEAEFRANLEQGDIIVIRYNGTKASSGHAMLYVGEEVLKNVDGYKGSAAEGTDENGVPKEEGYVYDIIHSTGSSFNFSQKFEKYEQYGSVQKTSVDSLFDSDNGRYVFSKVQYVAIIRPLNTFQGEVPEHTLNRMENMENVIAEKLSSHVVGMTVNPGETMTFTFSITNKNEQEVTLPITDILPANTAFVSSENCTMEGTSLSWTVTIPAGATQTVSYTVKVNEDVKPGDYVESTAGTVGGIPVNCPRIYIGRTLTENEQKSLQTAVNKLKNSGLQGLELANAIYEKTLGTKELLPNDHTALFDGVFMEEESFLYLTAEGTYQNLVAPGLFGGRLTIQRKTADEEHLARYEDLRTRLLTEDQLVAGDIIVTENGITKKVQAFYLYTGEGLLDLLTGETLTAEDSTKILTECLCCNCFVVLRPSLGMDSGK